MGADQPTTKFATGHKQAVDEFRQQQLMKAVDDVQYGEMPDFNTNPDGWKMRMTWRMKTRKVLKLFGMAPKDMTTGFILADTFQNLEKAGKMGDEQAAWDEFHRLLKDHVQKRRFARASTAEYQEQRAALFEYARSLGVPDFGTSATLMGTNAKPFDLDYRKGQIDIWAKNHPDLLERKVEETVAKPLTEWDTFDKQEDATTTPDDQKAIDALNAAVLEPLADAGEDKETTKVSEKPKHFSQEPGFFKKVQKAFQKRKESAMIQDYMAAAHDWFECESFTELTMPEDTFFKLLEDELKNRYEKPAESKPTTDDATSAKSDGQSGQNQNRGVVGHDDLETSNAPASPTDEIAAKKSADTFEIDPFLLEAKTLMGIPVMRMQEFINRPYEPWAKKQTKESFGMATVIDPLAVRQRFDKVFGPHGIGWRIVPVPHAAQTFLTPFTQSTQKGERDMYALTLSGYVMEYRIRLGDTVEWQRTSAFTDSNDSDDAGYAGGGAFSSLMKQALKMLGGYDHFIIPEKKRKAG